MKLDQIFKGRVCRPNGLIESIVPCCIVMNYRNDHQDPVPLRESALKKSSIDGKQYLDYL
jgi:hypothetical protein